MIITTQTVDQLCQLDPIFMDIKKQYGAPTNWQRPPGFVTLCRLILEQLVSLESAYSTYQKLDKYVAGTFTPERIAALSKEELRACSVSRQKAGYLHNVANAVLDGSLDFAKLAAMDNAAVHAYLTKIKGVGKWTANIYLIMVLQRRDILPLGDIAVIKTVKELKGAQDKKEVGEIGEQWQPLRSVATFFLWHYYLHQRNRNIDHIYAD